MESMRTVSGAFSCRPIGSLKTFALGSSASAAPYTFSGALPTWQLRGFQGDEPLSIQVGCRICQTGWLKKPTRTK